MEELLIKFCNLENQCKVGLQSQGHKGNNFLALPLFSSQIASGWVRHNEQELGGTFPPSFGASGKRGVTQHKQGNTKKAKMQKYNNELEATIPLSFGA